MARVESLSANKDTAAPTGGDSCAGSQAHVVCWLVH